MSNQISDDVLRKIKRCMDLSSSSNDNEAALALKQMQTLMDKHGVTSNHVMAYDVTEYSTKLDVLKHPANWVIFLHSTIGQAMDCECIIRRGGGIKARLIYLGVGSTPEISGYAFEVMLRKLKADRSEFIKTKLSRYKTANKTKLADAFCEGWISNVYRKVKNLNPNFEVKEKIKAYKETAMPNFKNNGFKSKSRVKSGDEKTQIAANIGFNKSKDVDLFAATGHTQQALIGDMA